MRAMKLDVSSRDFVSYRDRIDRVVSHDSRFGQRRLFTPLGLEPPKSRDKFKGIGSG